MNSKKQLFLVCVLWFHTTVKINIVLHTITMTSMLFGVHITIKIEVVCSQITIIIEVVWLQNNHKNRGGLAANSHKK